MVVVLIVLILLVIHYGATKEHIKSLISPLESPSAPLPNKPKVILMFTKWFGLQEWEYRMPDRFEADASPCPQTNCVLSYNQSQMRDSDALLFHGEDLPPAWALQELRQKDYEKLWIWHYLESPAHSKTDFSSFNDLFNWTFTYKRRSEIYFPYYQVVTLSENSTRPRKGTDFSKGKNKMVMAAISNCNVQRLNMVRELKRHVSFDLYGKCGPQVNPEVKHCPRFSKECETLQSKYKFYFAMESTYCSEYVTEKFFRNGLQNGLVPIVLGGGLYDEIGPPHSYINVLDFDNMESLGNYLKYLDNNATAYNEYHQWRYSYKIEGSHRICEICKALWKRDDQKVSPSENTGKNVAQFWDKEKNCMDWNIVLSPYIPAAIVG